MRGELRSLLALPLLVLPLLVPAEVWAGMRSEGYAISDGDAGGPGVIKWIATPPGGTSSPSFSASPLAVGLVRGEIGRHSGDINGDGVVDIVDALLALQASVGIVSLTAAETLRGDVAPLERGIALGDGAVDIEDAVLILRRAVGLGW